MRFINSDELNFCRSHHRGEEQNREEGEMAQIKLGGGRKKKLIFREEGEIGSKSREEGEIDSESREKGDLPPCSTPLTTGSTRSC